MSVMGPQPGVQMNDMQLNDTILGPDIEQDMLSLQNNELDADNNVRELTLGSVKPHLTSDLDRGIQQLTNSKNNIMGLQDTVSWRQYKQREVNALSRLNTKSEKVLASAIGGYNFTQRMISSTRSKSKNDPCGSMTCKQRGAKIKAALINLASFSPEALGSLGVNTAVSNAYDWGAKGIGLRTKQNPGQPESFQLQSQKPRSWNPFSRRGGRTRRRR